MFAVNHLPHVGEKRLLDLTERLCPIRPSGMREQVEALLHACSGGRDAGSASACALALTHNLETLLSEHDLV